MVLSGVHLFDLPTVCPSVHQLTCACFVIISRMTSNLVHSHLKSTPREVNCRYVDSTIEAIHWDIAFSMSAMTVTNSRRARRYKSKINLGFVCWNILRL